MNNKKRKTAPQGVIKLGKSFCKSHINLPFPYPMKMPNHNIRWPFGKSEHFMIINGHILHDEKLIAIYNLPAILALNKMGFFGAHSSREIIFKSMIESQQQQQQSTKHPKRKPKFTVGFFSLKTVDIPNALTNFSNDTNKLKLDANNDEKSQSKSKQNLLNCMKLNLEEAYFLTSVFGLIRFDNHNLDELWCCFCKLSGNHMKFITKYASYYFFRSHGFVINNGFKFGVDFLLYEEGPPFNHSHYAVIVDYKYDDELNDDNDAANHLKYNEISGLIRISNNSRKELLLCTVIIPSHFRKIFNENDYSSSACISLFKINIIQLKRNTLDLWQK